jgi:NADH dehydrogenase [ubiquinone] 1 alpha subcomplex assembly factor 7
VTEEARRAIVSAIDDHGPITFAEFMQHALYGQGGYYERPPVGPEGDFVTSPHVHPMFADMLGRALRSLHELLGRPAPFTIAEVGAGDGTLARQLLEVLSDLPVDYRAIEISSGARDSLRTLDAVTVSERLDGHTDLVIANELLDNLPFRVLRGDREVRIGHDSGGLVEVLVPPDPELASHVTADGAERTVPVGSFSFVDELAASLPPRGYALLIDYAWDEGSDGPLHGYRRHDVVEDVLALPGDTDITAGVDLGSIVAHAERAGLFAYPTVTQHDALMALGFEMWFREQLAAQQAQLDAGDGLTAVRTWAGKSRATLLADPGGLGRFRWLLLGTQDLPAPSWLG